MPPVTADLTRLLRNRPELAVAPSLEVLERLLARPDLAIPVLLDLDADCHTVSQAIQAAGGETTRDMLSATLRDPHGRLGEVLDLLAGRGLIALDGDTVRSPHHPGLWAHPFALGRPLREFEKKVTAEALKTMVKALGGQPLGRKADLVRRAEELLRDGASVRSRAAKLPSQAVALAESMASRAPVLGGEQLYYGSVSRTHPVQRLVDAGFVLRDGWEFEMPREVALALRGDGWKPALTGQPDVPARPCPEADGAGAALAAIDRIQALVELAGTEQITELKSGGVGVRELRRLAKLLGVSEQEAVLWLDIAFGADLIASELGERLVSTTLVDDWLAHSPDARWRALADVWLRLPQAATYRVVGCCEDHMEPLPPPYEFECGAGRIRRATLETLRTLIPGLGTDAAGLKDAVAWRTRAAAEAAQAADEFVAAALREGELLGIVAGGALTSLGRALLGNGEQDPDTGGVSALFPTPVTTATLQNDLTAIVSGIPAADLAIFLNGCADLESRDRASVWRFSEKTIRRALDAGTTAETLLADLARFSAKAIPQPLRYLVNDTARKHGVIKVTSTPSIVIATDPAVIAELCGAKALRKLGLRQIAPTVALAALPPDETLRLLRQGGHAPVGVASDGTIRAESIQRRRLAVDVKKHTDTDTAAAAAAILQGNGTDADGEAMALAAVTGEVIVIVWQRREHYMEDLTIAGNVVTGYCHDCDRDHTIPRAKITKAYLP
ncbi:helicase-associated domain-containing protein [Nonomuraea turcica]|uniref:helicase-associated domain-containing protein n=1 Tax=Nonomuraea sp. G32 TaxID=3067274 RepID=UPI00273C2EDB|nr:helicase-associated domain-containing protein [Nonomuraea sp. G32]MDP4508281.1 helicase-associated domain-containing protein [Nonomuraea sp. G32]